MNGRRFASAIRRWYSVGLMLLIVYACSFPVPVDAAETWTSYGKIGHLSGSGLGKFYFPQGLAVDGSGNVYVADQGNNRIQKLDVAGDSWSSIQGPPLSQFNAPMGVALDSGGNIYVAEYSSSRVQKLDIATNTWKTWAPGNFNKPSGIAVDTSGNVYVADTDNSRIRKLPVDTDTWITMDGLTLNKPKDVATDSSKNVYVLDTNNHRLLKLSSGGIVTDSWGKSGNAAGTALGEFSSPAKVAVDSSDNVYVADTGNGRVQKLSGSTWSAIGKNGPISGGGLNEFNNPLGVTVDGNGNVYVSEAMNHAVLKLTGAAPVVYGDVGPAEGNAPGEFKVPSGVAIDSSGNLYVADGNNFRVQKLPAGGSTWSSYGAGTHGAGNGQFKNATAVAVDQNGNMYVADMPNHRIQKLSPTVGYLAAWGNGTTAGTALGQFDSPSGVAVDKNKNLYVADTNNHRIQKLPAGGSTWSSWGKSGNASGSGLGEFNSPKGVAVDGDGNVYVADTENDRIQKFTISTGLWSEWKKTGGGPGSFLKPNGVAVDDSGNVYVADLARNRIQKLTLSTNTWKVWGGSTQGETGMGKFSNPSGIAVDSSGSTIYVADKNNNRIQKLVITVTTPDAPTAVTATPGNTQATVSFTPPAEDGGSAITGYTVTASPGGKTVSGTSSPITVTGLTNLTAYTFTVVATNEKGDSLPSAASASVTPASVPDAPTGASATAGNGQASVSFTPPASDGGSAITGYTVTSNPGGKTGTSVTVPISVYGLTNGTAYTFTVVANNAIGGSTPSEPTASVTPVGKPGAPTAVNAAAMSGAAIVSFTPPASNGGSAITGYTVTSSPGGLTGTGTASPIIVPGLTNGTAYTFTVVATNGEGDSLPSAASGSVMPAATPGSPTEVTAVSTSSGQASISFTPPASSGGSAITGYTVTASPGGLTGTGSGSPITVYGLTNGTAYTFTVVATNGIGNSLPSAPSGSVTPASVPDAPTGAAATPGNRQALVSFTPPASNGSAITGYTVTSNPGGLTGSGTASPILVTGLTNGTAYTFTVVATNAKGDSLPSAATPSVTPEVPPIEAPVLHSVVAGDGQALLAWSPVAGSTGYKVFQSVTAGTYGTEVAAVGEAVHSYRATGLTNGVTYYFAIKATSPYGDSAASNQAGATPLVSAPGAPVLQAAAAGNGQVTLAWNAVPGSIGYKVFQSVTAGTYGSEVATVGEAVYSYKATGLSNGVTYYYVVKATNPAGDSAASNQVSAMPVNVPGAPTDVVATAEDSMATVSFTAPADHGGSPVTGYEVSAWPGGIVATGGASPIRVQGLANGTVYTFTVKAINRVGGSAPSAPSNAVTPSASDSDAGTPTDTPVNTPAPTTPTISETPGTGVDVLINGKAESAGTATTVKAGDRTVTTVAIDPQKLEEKLAAEGERAVITIPVKTNADVVIGELNGRMVKNMEQKLAIVEIATEKAVYTLPAQQINIQAIAEQLGRNVELQDIKVRIEIAAPSADMVKVVESSAARGEFSIVAPPLNFTVKAAYGDTTIEVSHFNAYVERRIAIPKGTDPAKITTAVVVDPDGAVRHVPTRIVIVDGSYYAIVNSLTNSTYAVVWHPQQFKDVAGHWAQDAVNDMGSRMVVSGVGNDLFNPDQEITRAEFAAILVSGLGLKLEKAASPFADVKAPEWYVDVIQTAYAGKLISGFEDGTFRPMDNITREQAMTIMASAMKLTGLKAKLASAQAGVPLGSFADANKVAEWAASGITDCLQAGIVSGRDGAKLAPKAYMTRAEVAIMMQKLLQYSELI
ncbi:fibronectin type III domain-containing protein [Paenibacillus ginsengarvi]|nr:fibronectin type III domain-containing protein [Paenibacillus ginsengarvi]